MNTESPKQEVFTAAQMASALGISKQAFAKALGDMEPTVRRRVKGNETSFWAATSLPAAAKERLQERATQERCRTIEELIASTAKPDKELVPISDCADRAIEKAIRLRDALRGALARRNDLSLSRTQFEELGLVEYRQAFGHPITARHWWNLFNRTTERAGANEDFERIELYLDENPARRNSTERAQLDEGEFAKVNDVISNWRDVRALSDAEERSIWCAACETYQAACDSDDAPARVKAGLIDLLLRRLPDLAPGRKALQAAFRRRYAVWLRGDRNPSALKDRRIEANHKRRLKVPEADLDILKAHGIFACGGRVSQAWRECLDNKWLSESVASRFVANPASKSQVPAAVREAIRHEINLFLEYHHSPRQVRDNGAYIDRYWDCVASLDFFCADDCTAPILFWVPDGKGRVTSMRGQFLLLVCARTECVLGYALMPERNYNSRVIRSLITKVSEERGLPREGFYFERGIWKDSRILTGDANATPFTWEETELGLREFGLRFIHAIRARSKPVERVLGALQNLMEGLPGYLGRDERYDRFDAIKRAKLEGETRKRDPRGTFFSLEQWDAKLGELCQRYNAEPQQGKKLKGLSPEDALEKFKRRDDPPIRFDAKCRYLLAHHKRPVRVTALCCRRRLGFVMITRLFQWLRRSGSLKSRFRPWRLTAFASVCCSSLWNVAVGSVNDWTYQNPKPTQNNLTGIAYGSGRFVAVDYNGHIFSSTDGIKWIQQRSGNANTLWGAVTFGGGKFVVLGDGPSALVSDDGLRWSLHDFSERSVNPPLSVAYGNGVFLAVASGVRGQVFRSTDAIQWTEVYRTNRMVLVDSLGFGGGVFVGVGKQGLIVTSEFGTVWERRGEQLLGELRGIAFGDEKWIAVAQDGAVWRSTDGENWQIKRGVSEQPLNNIGFAEHKFIAVGGPDGGQGFILLSKDGDKWEEAARANVPFRDVAFGAGRFVAVGDYNVIRFSRDGSSWQAATTPPSPPSDWRRYSSVAYGNGQFIAASATGVDKSSDGISWSSVAVPLFGAKHVAFLNGFFFIPAFITVWLANAATTLLDPDFAPDGGPGRLPHPSAQSTLTGLAIQPDGKIVVVGSFAGPTGIRVHRIARYNANGTVDPVFTTKTYHT